MGGGGGGGCGWYLIWKPQKQCCLWAQIFNKNSISSIHLFARFLFLSYFLFLSKNLPSYVSIFPCFAFSLVTSNDKKPYIAHAITIFPSLTSPHPHLRFMILELIWKRQWMVKPHCRKLSHDTLFRYHLVVLLYIMTPRSVYLYIHISEGK